MNVRFNVKWDGHEARSTAQLEPEVARRLIDSGVATLASSVSQKTVEAAPENKMVEEAPKKKRGRPPKKKEAFVHPAMR